MLVVNDGRLSYAWRLFGFLQIQPAPPIFSPSFLDFSIRL